LDGNRHLGEHTLVRAILTANVVGLSGKFIGVTARKRAVYWLMAIFYALLFFFLLIH